MTDGFNAQVTVCTAHTDAFSSGQRHGDKTCTPTVEFGVSKVDIRVALAKGVICFMHTPHHVPLNDTDNADISRPWGLQCVLQLVFCLCFGLAVGLSCVLACLVV